MNAIKKLLDDAFNDINTHIVGHNIAFDLHVILKQYPEYWPNVWDALHDGRIHDTMIREKLYALSTAGTVKRKQGYSLASLAMDHLGVDMSADKAGDGVRFKYGDLMDTPIAEWDAEAVRYAADDAIHTLNIFRQQIAADTQIGPGSINGESLQVAAAFALRYMSICGISIDQVEVNRIKDEYNDKYNAVITELQRYGIIKPDGKRDQKALEAECMRAGVTDKTDTGRIKTDRKTLAKISQPSLAIQAYLEYSDLQKAVNTFIPQMGVDRIHPMYNEIVDTLRTSCRASNYYKYKGETYGKKVIKRGHALPSINMQQIPRKGPFRKAFIPEPGCVFLCADYGNLELVCAAQTYFRLRNKSDLRDVLNTGQNMHDATGTLIYNDHTGSELTVEAFRSLISGGDATAKFCRQTAKFVNLGCPGGQSAKTIHKLANEAGISISLEQATAWREAARGRFADFSHFFDTYLPNLQGRDIIIGGRYTQGYSFVCQGVYFANRTYTATANGFCMQIPAAVGKKYALVALVEACTNPDRMSPLYGCTPHLDVHDELLVSVEDTGDELFIQRKMELAAIMVQSMAHVCPDMRIGIEMMTMRRWGKDPEQEFGAEDYYKMPDGEEIYYE